MTVAVTTLNAPAHQPPTAHKRQPTPSNATTTNPLTPNPSPTTIAVPPTTSNSAHASQPVTTQSRHTSSRAFSRTVTSFRFLLGLLLFVTFLFAVAQLPLRTLHFALSSFLPYISPSYFNYYLYSFRRFSRTLLHSYQRQLHIRPLSSRAITAGLIFFLADLTAQLLSRPHRKPLHSYFSLIRLARYSLYGLFFMGPLLYIWYDTMNRFGPPDDLQGSVMKSVFEQLTLEPLCISAYLIYDGICAGKSYRLISNTLRTRFWPLWFNNSAFWVPANFANYYVGTPDMRVVFSNLCSLFWNIYFSAKVNGFLPIPQRPNHNGQSTDASVLPTTTKDATTSSTEGLPSSNTTRSRRATANSSTTISVTSVPRSPPQRKPQLPPNHSSNVAESSPPNNPQSGARSRSLGHAQHQHQYEANRHHHLSDRTTHTNSQVEQQHFHSTNSAPPLLPRLVTSNSLRS